MEASYCLAPTPETPRHVLENASSVGTLRGNRSCSQWCVHDSPSLLDPVPQSQGQPRQEVTSAWSVPGIECADSDKRVLAMHPEIIASFLIGEAGLSSAPSEMRRLTLV